MKARPLLQGAFCLLAAGALYAGLAGPVLALDVPEHPSQGYVYDPAGILSPPAKGRHPSQGYVYDPAGILSPPAKGRLNAALAQYENQTTNQIVVALFPTLDSESLEDFTIRLAEAWKPGQAGKDNGVILAVFKQERKIRIEVGYGLEGALPDAETGLIIRRVMAPYFKQGKFDEGVIAGVAAVMQAVEGEFGAQAPRRAYGGRSAYREFTPKEAAALRRKGAAMAVVIAVVLLILFLFDVARYFRYRKDHRLYRESYSFWEWFFRFAVLLAVLSLVFRMLFYMMLFSRGGYAGGRGGFSGGGGSFGGGGASGSW